MRFVDALALVAVGLAAQACARPATTPPRAGQKTAAWKATDSAFARWQAPAGDRPAALRADFEGHAAAILPNGRTLTPLGKEVALGAPRPFGLALARDGGVAATVNVGATPSVTLIRNVAAAKPVTAQVDLGTTFMGIAFSRDGKRFFASGGDLGNVWIGDVASARVVGSVSLNGAAHRLAAPLAPARTPSGAFKGAFPGAMALDAAGRYLYVVDQAAFQVHVVDTSALATGTNAEGAILEPNNLAAVVGRAATGRYPWAIALAADGAALLVTNVGMFQYAHLRPASPTGKSDEDYPLCIPATAYPDDVAQDKTIAITRIDATRASALPLALRDPAGIRCGYVPDDLTYTVPGLGSPNVDASSSTWVYTLADPRAPRLLRAVPTGPRVGELRGGIATYGGSHPNAVVAGRRAVFVSNGNDDTVTILDRARLEPVADVRLAVLDGEDARLKGVQPVALALDADERLLFVAEAGLNAVGVVDVSSPSPRVLGHVPVGWWPSGVAATPDGRRLVVVAAKGRGSGPNQGGHEPRHGAGTVQIIERAGLLDRLPALTRQVLRNNGLLDQPPPLLAAPDGGPLPGRPGAASRQIKHVVFINKENATHDLLLGDIVATRRGVKVEGDPAYSLGPGATPNHHELALSFTFGDNFYLEPAVSSDGHRWLTNSYTTELEEATWPPYYGGGGRAASGDDPEIIASYPGRIGFSGANSSPEPHDYNAHGGIYMHLDRHGLPLAIFGNGFEFAGVDEEPHTEPTGIREHVNVPMERVVRDNADHLYPEYNTSIPDAPLPEEPDRFNRFARFRQVFEAQYVDRAHGECKLPAYVDLYYPNDHGGHANDMHPDGPAWDFRRYVQDNDAALGLTVELISKSPCWGSTVIFVVEDDTQNGLDHVDGHRSLFLAIGPWVKRQHVTKRHLSLASIFKTVDLLFGMPPLNQYDAAASDLGDVFSATPDFTPYSYRPPIFETRHAAAWKRFTRGIDLSRPDVSEVRLRRAIARSEGLPRRR